MDLDRYKQPAYKRLYLNRVFRSVIISLECDTVNYQIIQSYKVFFFYKKKANSNTLLEEYKNKVGEFVLYFFKSQKCQLIEFFSYLDPFSWKLTAVKGAKVYELCSTFQFGLIHFAT